MAGDWFSLGNIQQLEVLIMSSTFACCSASCVYTEFLIQSKQVTLRKGENLSSELRQQPIENAVTIVDDGGSGRICLHCILDGMHDVDHAIHFFAANSGYVTSDSSSDAGFDPSYEELRNDRTLLGD